MATPSVTQAVIHALADYLRQQLPTQIQGDSDPVGILTSNIREGWPAPEDTLSYPTLAIDAPQGGERISHAPILLSSSFPATPPAGQPVDAASIASVYSVGTFVVPMLLGIYASSTADRSRVVQALEVALAGDVVSGAGILELVSADYYGQQIGYRISASVRFTDTPGRVISSEWHAQMTVEAEVEEIVPVSEKRIVELDLEWTVPPDGPVVETERIFP